MSRFVYVTYIRTTPEHLWRALTDPQFQIKYWFGMHQKSDWTAGASWKLCFADGRIADEGEVLEIDPPRRLVLSWRHQLAPELKAEGEARCIFELEPLEDAVKLTITHSSEATPSRLIDKISGGWPKILASLKSLLETGEALAAIHRPAA